MLQTESWVRPPGSHLVTLAERDHLLGFKQLQTEIPLEGVDAVTSGDQRPTFRFMKHGEHDDGCSHRVDVFGNVRL